MFEPISVLRDYFEDHGYLRIKPYDPTKHQSSGVELRIVVRTTTEQREVIQALKALKIKHGRPYKKQKGRKDVIVPIYDRSAALQVLELIKPKGYASETKQLREILKKRPPKEAGKTQAGKKASIAKKGSKSVKAKAKTPKPS
jgi:hypothetical protein